jgi:hypothetical protein
VAERTNAAVLKTAVGQPTVGSNPTPSAMISSVEQCSGHNARRPPLTKGAAMATTSNASGLARVNGIELAYQIFGKGIR